MDTKELIKKDRPTIMGILNLTPDSFSDGGEHNKAESAIRRVKQMEEEGADMIDIGGESTGPSSENVSLEDEIERVIPILKAIKKRTNLPISVDTYKAEVAKTALEEGADLINDVTALRGDEKMPEVIRTYGCPIVLMFSKDSTPRTTREEKHYENVTQHIKDFLEERIEFSQKSGIKKDQIIIDPGMGAFISAIPKYSYEVIANLKEFRELTAPILIGISRKSFLGGKLAARDGKSAGLSAVAYLNGASIIRTHNIKETLSCLNWK